MERLGTAQSPLRRAGDALGRFWCRWWLWGGPLGEISQSLHGVGDVGSRDGPGLVPCSRPPCQDGSGFIDEHELDALLKDLYEKNKKVSGDRRGGTEPLGTGTSRGTPPARGPPPSLPACPRPHGPCPGRAGGGGGGSRDGGSRGLPAPMGARRAPTHPQEMSIQQLTNYRRSIMSLSDGGRLYRKELEIVLCSEPPV